MVITVNGERKEIPECFEALTAQQYELMVPEFAKEIDERDHFRIFQILAGTEFADFHATAENEVTIWNAIRWLYEQPFVFGDVPKVLKINDKVVIIPKDIKKLSIGQNIHLKQLLSETTYLEENISAACAIYMQPLYEERKFDFDRAMELKKVIEGMPAYLIRPIGFFLLNHALPHGRKQTSFLRRMISSPMQRCTAMWQRWQKSSDLYLSRT